MTKEVVKLNGLFLQGGGAKGAFQAGVIYGLYERGYNFNVISGTSIGAIHGYFIYKDEIEKLKSFWLGNGVDLVNKDMYFNRVIENQGVIDYLKNLDGENSEVDKAYVNYVHVENKQLKEVVVDITKSPDRDKLKAIKYSALLPYRVNGYCSIEDINNDFDSSNMYDNFVEDLESGIYESYNLDGGMINNNFLSPFVKNKVDKLYLIVFRKGYRIPDYIKRNYSEEDVVVIEPETAFKPEDTLRFEYDFVKSIFEEGYDVSQRMSC